MPVIVDAGLGAPSHAAAALEVGWADAVMISGSPRDAFADDEWTHGLMAKVARLLEKKKPVLGVCYGHQILGSGNWELGIGKWELGSGN